jgi:hypothetical protein
MDNCVYCNTPGKVRVIKTSGVGSDIYACDGCWELLKDPKTALPLIRGHLTITLRDTVPKSTLDRVLNVFMEKISAWKQQN